jgi:hypothetical protein
MTTASLSDQSTVMNDLESAHHSLTWMSETIDLGKKKNVFENRVTEYRSGASSSWNKAHAASLRSEFRLRRPSAAAIAWSAWEDRS